MDREPYRHPLEPGLPMMTTHDVNTMLKILLALHERMREIERKLDEVLREVRELRRQIERRGEHGAADR